MSNSSGDTREAIERLLFEKLDIANSLRELCKKHNIIIMDGFFYKESPMFFDIKLKDNNKK